MIGRYFAMDRDKRWERNKLAWDAIVLGARARQSTDAERGGASRLSARIRAAMSSFSRSSSRTRNEQRVRDGDVVLWFNFRSDRARQLSDAFLLPDFAGFDREVRPKVHYVTLTEYDKTYACPVRLRPAIA